MENYDKAAFHKYAGNGEKEHIVSEGLMEGSQALDYKYVHLRPTDRHI